MPSGALSVLDRAVCPAADSVHWLTGSIAVSAKEALLSQRGRLSNARSRVHAVIGPCWCWAACRSCVVVSQSCVVATRLGVIDPPTTVAALDAAIDSYRTELQGTEAARDAARFLLLRPPLPWSARPGYSAMAGAAVSLLPQWARQPLRLPYLPLAERAIAIPVGGAATSVIRWALKHPHEPRT